MIRKPPANWNAPDEGAGVRTVRTAAAVAKTSADVARRGALTARGLALLFQAAVAGWSATVGLFNLPAFIVVGTIAVVSFWLGLRSIAKARAM